MRRRHSAPAGPSVTLFPFLAVLICMMGVLITLLVVASRAAEVRREQIDRAQADDFEDQIAELEFLREEQDLKWHVLMRTQEQAREQLHQSRLRRAHLDDELQRLESRYALAAHRAKQLADDAPPSAVDDQTLQWLAEQIQTAETEVAERLNLQRNRPTGYSIIAHPSRNGTRRRPMYVECTRDSVILQPNGIVIAAHELAPPLLPGNPLDAALLAIRNYWKTYDLAGEHGEPYPLLIVRPDGAQTYALVRRAMQSWTDEFGYELVEKEKVLDYGAADPNLESVLQSTLQTARAQYRELHRIAQSSLKAAEAERGLGGYRPSAAGGFEWIGNPSSSTSRNAHGSRGSPPAAAGGPAAQSAPTAATQKTEGQASGQPNLVAAGNPTGDCEVCDTPDGMPPSSPASLNPLSLERGENWALPARGNTSIAYRRAVLVHCRADALILDGGTQRHESVHIPWNSDVDSVDRLVGAIWEVIKTWGIAEKNGYWKPELRFVVEQGGQTTFERVQILLQGSGFDVTRAQFQ